MITRYAQHDLSWVDLVSPSPAEVKAVMREFDLDPLIAEELLTPSFKPKVERRGDSVYVILHFPALRGTNSRAEQEIDFVIGKKFLITTRYENIDPLHSFARAFEVQSVLGRGGMTHGGHLFATMARALYESLATECEQVQHRLQDIEERIFSGEEQRMVAELSHAARIIFDFRQALLPHRDMLASLEPVVARFFGHEAAYYARDVEGACGRVLRLLDHLRESLQELRATNDSLLNTKQNEIMKTLTIMAFVTFPLTLISSIFGMNTSWLPLIGVRGDFWMIVGMMGLLALAFFVYFKRKGWL